jgi:UDP-N-acetylmuramate--alanine ligase
MTETYHLIGIGGAGMSGLARLLLGAGTPVQGSDLRLGETSAALAAAGARVFEGHRTENVAGATQVIYSAAVPEENPELVEARRLGLPTVPRAEMLARVMEGKIGVAIAGTHGKTTTTGLLASAFLAAGADSSVLVGGEWSALNGNARAGSGPHFLAEACEAFDSFLELSPQIVLLTNVEADHLDWHGSLEGVLTAFRKFLARVSRNGYVVGCGEDENVRALLAQSGLRTVTYAIDGDADYTATDVQLEGRSPSFTVRRQGEAVGTVRLSVPGRHNVLNALGAAAVALEEGLEFAGIARGLESFTGVGRRFETLGDVSGVLVLDDYAHHPTEVRATLAATRGALGRRTTVVFQPHLYSRTQLLLEDFATSFGDADRVVVTEIYGAREAPIPGISGELLAQRIAAKSNGPTVEFAPKLEGLAQKLAAEARSGDVVMTMGAGNIRSVGEELVSELRQQTADSSQ